MITFLRIEKKKQKFHFFRSYKLIFFFAIYRWIWTFEFSLTWKTIDETNIVNGDARVIVRRHKFQKYPVRLTFDPEIENASCPSVKHYKNTHTHMNFNDEISAKTYQERGIADFALILTLLCCSGNAPPLPNWYDFPSRWTFVSCHFPSRPDAFLPRDDIAHP